MSEESGYTTDIEGSLETSLSVDPLGIIIQITIDNEVVGVMMPIEDVDIFIKELQTLVEMSREESVH